MPCSTNIKNKTSNGVFLVKTNVIIYQVILVRVEQQFTRTKMVTHPLTGPSVEIYVD